MGGSIFTGQCFLGGGGTRVGAPGSGARSAALESVMSDD